MQASRGTPAYMAPELFQDGATQSTASDLWALGCVLYECASGRAPFVNPSFSELVRLILHADYAPLPDASPEFANLISRLLDKNPATRMTWAEMLTHPFWQFTLEVRPMPAEPALERYIARHGLAPKADGGAAAALEDKKAGERAKLCAASHFDMLAVVQIVVVCLHAANEATEMQLCRSSLTPGASL
jgi:Protein kinase domain